MHQHFVVVVAYVCSAIIAKFIKVAAQNLLG